MKLYKIFLFSLLLTLCYACSKKEKLRAHISNCPSIADAEILTETEKQNECHYLEVYRYLGEICTLCECCVCDKQAIITNCEGEPLCGEENTCWLDFLEKREYLFCVKPI